MNRTISTHMRHPVARNDAKVGKASGILGLTALALMLLLPLCYVIAAALDSEVVALVLYFGDLLFTVAQVFWRSHLGSTPTEGHWAVVGIVTSLLSLVLSLATVMVAILLG